jgi:putative copper export protein
VPGDIASDAFAWASFAARLGFNLAALLAIGLALHAVFGIARTQETRRLALGAALAALIILALRWLVSVAQLGGTWAGAFDPALQAMMWSTLGATYLAAAAGSVLVATGAAARSRPASAAGAGFLAASYGLAGHAVALDPPGPWPAVVALHVALVGFWLAAPATLWPRAGLADEGLVARLRRFSRIAIVLAPLALVLGLAAAWTLAGGMAGLLGTPYGQLLLAKTLAAAGALGFGAANQRWITGLVEHDAPRGRRWLARTLAAEAALFVFAAVAVSVATSRVGPASAAGLNG